MNAPPKCPTTDKWIKKMWIVFFIKKRVKPYHFLVADMYLEDIIWNKQSTESQRPHDHTHMWDVKLWFYRSRA